MAQQVGTNDLIETWASTGNVIEPPLPKQNGGWEFEEQPPHEYMNWIHNVLGKQINYLMRQGVPEWNNQTTYTTSSVVTRNNTIWVSTAPNANSEPTPSNTNWVGFDGSAFAPVSAGVPAGAVQQFAMSVPPAGWLKCNGDAVSRATYPVLFTAVGTTWGEGDGATTFNLPDLRGEFVRGWDDGRGVDAGRDFASFQAGQNQSHDHTFSGTTGETSPFTQPVVTVGGAVRAREGNSAYAENQGTGSHAHTFSGTTSQNGGLEARPRNMSLLHCIKV